MKNSKGFIIPLIILVIAVGALGGGYYYYSQKRGSDEFDDPRKQEILDDFKQQLEEANLDEAKLKSTNAQSKSLISQLRLDFTLSREERGEYPTLLAGCHPVSDLLPVARHAGVIKRVNAMLAHEKENLGVSFFVGMPISGNERVYGVSLLGSEEGRVIPSTVSNPTNVLGCNCTGKTFCQYDSR